MARRVYLHVGTPKSGTTFLQELWWRHRDALADRGLLLPGRSAQQHFHAAIVVKDLTEVLVELDADQRGAWPVLVDEVAAWAGDALISSEHFADTPAPRAEAALADLAAAAEQVHVLVTVRSLAQLLPSAWQQRVKQGSPVPLGAFLDDVRTGRETRFEGFQDVVGVVDRWASQLPPERVTLVTVPPPGAPRDLLWGRAGTALDVDVAGLDADSRRPNESLSLVETELLRRVNAAVPAAERDLALARVTKGTFARTVLAGTAPGEPIPLPAEHAAWVRQRAEATVAALSERGHRVVGDLADLLPSALPPGRSPDEADPDELLDAATAAIGRMLLAQRDRRRRRRDG